MRSLPSPFLEEFMSIDWMNSLIIVTFMSVWVLIGQFSFIKQ